LRFASLASGSSGNCLVAEADRTVVLIDCGLSLTETERRLARLGLEPSQVSAILITHEHSDHAAGSFEFAAAHRIHVVLKGHRTVIATPDGRTFVNLTGNPGMATGGTGDLLTGMVAAWFAQLLDAEAACKLAVYLHGTAGDLAEADEGDVALVAGDIASRLGDAVLELTAKRTRKRES